MKSNFWLKLVSFPHRAFFNLFYTRSTTKRQFFTRGLSWRSLGCILLLAIPFSPESWTHQQDCRSLNTSLSEISQMFSFPSIRRETMIYYTRFSSKLQSPCGTILKIFWGQNSFKIRCKVENHNKTEILPLYPHPQKLFRKKFLPRDIFPTSQKERKA